MIVCQHCSFAIPSVYLRDIRKTPPVFVQLMGLSSVGKTTFLDMLRLQLSRISKMWPDAYAMPVTQKDFEDQHILRADVQYGRLSAATMRQSLEQNEPYITQLMNFERWNSHFLVLLDFSGEQFQTLYIAPEEMPFFCRVPVTIMLLSLPDMQRNGQTMDNVLSTYVRTLESQRIKLARRELIIVLNKLDLISSLPQEVKDYLLQDTLYRQLRDQPRIPNMSGKDLLQYLEQMKHISDILGQWIQSVDGGAGLWAMLRNKRIGVRFCAMSATGYQINQGNPLSPLPQRIFDPFFWVMQYYAEHW